MASVLETYQELPLKDHEFEFSSTWAPTDRFKGLGPTLASAGRLVGSRWRRRQEARPIAHLHMSEGGSFIREGGLALLAHTLGLGVVTSMHGADLGPFVLEHPRLVATVLGRVDAVLALGPGTADLLAPYTSGRARVCVIANPVEMPAEVTPAGDTPPRVVFGGEIGRRKGVDVLLEAWSAVRDAVPDAELIIAGPPGDIEPREVDGVRWLGPVERTSIGTLVEGARVAVLPSRQEVMPMFLLEAMSRARPIVTTDVGEIRQLVSDPATLLEPGDAAGLAHQLITLLRNPGSATAAGDLLRERVAGRFSPAVVAAQLEELYDSIGIAPGSSADPTSSASVSGAATP
jgi:glycosyltransferase involved in cell wall biosynthesis